MEKALSQHDFKAVKKLLKHKHWIKQKFPNEQSALHVASDYGDKKIVELLLKHKAGPNEIDSSEQTALHVACKQNNLSLVSLLISYNASVSIASFQGNTPLHFLASKSNPSNLSSFYDVLEEIKASGADINQRNNQGDTPLHFACLKRAEKAAMWLIRQNADLSISNDKGETVLHVAARFCSAEFVSLLLKAGATSTKNMEGASPRTHASNAGRSEIITLLESNEKKEINVAASQDSSISLNGCEVTIEQFLHYKELLLKEREEQIATVAAEQQRNRTRRNSRLSFSEETEVSKRNEWLLSIVEINYSLFGRTPGLKHKWSGIIRFPQSSDASGTWNSRHCHIKEKVISVSIDENGPETEQISLEKVTSFRVYFDIPSRFSILFYQRSGNETKHFAATPDQVLTIVKILVDNTGKPVEFVDETPLLPILEALEPKTECTIRHKRKKKSRMRNSLANFQMPMSPRRNTNPIPGSKVKRTTSGPLRMQQEIQPQVEIEPESEIHSLTSFASLFFSEIFSSNIMEIYGRDRTFLITAGEPKDLLHYLILHSGIPTCNSQSDLEAFYMSYYRYCEPEAILQSITNIWPQHSSTFWPAPYNRYHHNARLFAFIAGFVRSSFVLTDLAKEMKFRDDLVTLYGKLVPSAYDKGKSFSKLQEIAKDVKKMQSKLSVNQLCDFKSLLRATEEPIDFMLEDLQPSEIASQIVQISADLFRQLQIAEFLDLRYQKEKDFSVSLNKVHAFSNKIYLLVPTTILQSENISAQQSALKKWIIIAEKLFELRDYNSTIQVINGITETSVMRLDHLKGSLSLKWIQRFDALRNTFSSEGNYAKYRCLPMESPCIPFIGVALKDLVYVYEGMTDKTGEGINFQKMRKIAKVVRSLHLQVPEQLNYYFLSFDAKVAQILLNYSPMNQDELYARSVQIGESIKNSSEDDEDSSRDYATERKEVLKEIKRMQKKRISSPQVAVRKSSNSN